MDPVFVEWVGTDVVLYGSSAAHRVVVAAAMTGEFGDWGPGLGVNPQHGGDDDAHRAHTGTGVGHAQPASAARCRSGTVASGYPSQS